MPKTASKLNNKTNRKKSSSESQSVIKAQLLIFAIYLSIFLVICAINLLADLNSKYDYYISLLSFVISSFISGFLGGIKQRQNSILSGLIYALPANLSVLLISLITAGFTLKANFLIAAVSLPISSILGGIIAVNKRRRR